MADKSSLPEKYDHLDIESKWIAAWEKMQTYRWNSSVPRESTFVVDTPPPTVSGSLHVGHVFSYTHTDVIVRYQRMTGKNIFYPMGWDDNGLPTERRVQNYYNIRCEANLPYEPGWKPEPATGKDSGSPRSVSRQNFIEACDQLTKQDELAFRQLWTRLGLSVDWSLEYATIDEHCRKISQLSFLDLLQKGFAYSSESPNMWDVDFKSAVAQAEVEDKEVGGAFHDIRFGIEGSDEEFIIATTRPELLPACIAVVAHPDDKRYQHLFGKRAVTPLFHAPVPICAAEHADPEKGSGILMVCTFGDIMDVEWWKHSKLPLKQIIGRDGCLLEVKHCTEAQASSAFVSLSPEKANSAYQSLQGSYVKKARKLIADMLAQDGSAVNGRGAALVGEPKQIMHSVKFFEKGDRPLEFIPTRQWYIKIMDFKEELKAQGQKIEWHPKHMYSRFEHWVEGLNQDWCYSRQRYFGVPFPVWYKLDQQGQPDYENPILAEIEHLPVDPLSQTPKGYTEDQRGKPGGFIGDPDVMDTWSTSSMTPQIMSYWGVDKARHEQLFPMDLRPQGHDIIRTWAFTTITKAWQHEGKIPWKHIALSGWILDPDRKKMSKSKGNVVTPGHLLEEFSSDAVRYWAARARLGTDTAFDESVFKIGRKLTTKVFNASKFVLMQLERAGINPADCDQSLIVEELDRALILQLRAVIESATRSFEKFDYAAALQTTEDEFWNFCDNYLELVKARSYSEQDSPARTSALVTLSVALETFLRLFAPFLPYICEEVWSWAYAGENGRSNSVHSANWPAMGEFSQVKPPKEQQSYIVAAELISHIRGAKTRAQKSLKTEVAALSLECCASTKAALDSVIDDVLRAGNVQANAVSFRLKDQDSLPHFACEIQLAE